MTPYALDRYSSGSSGGTASAVAAGLLPVGHGSDGAAADLMAAVPRGKMIVVEDAGHLIPQENPAVVRETVFGVVEQLP